MLAKGVIRDIVAWKSCRAYFYWRLKRRVEELRLADGLCAAGTPSYDAAMKSIEKVVPAKGSDKDAFEALAKLATKDLS